MVNLSQQKREKMTEFLETIRQEHKNDDGVLIAINEIENELNEKKYGLVWEKNEEAVDVQMRENIPVFTECKEKEINAAPGDGYNFILEGDNLHSLKLLEKTHTGKIDVIYIDPPYNTGKKDFKYDDNYIDLEDGFRHSKWLSFMDPRLRIAHKLMSNRGVIFISIDDHEQAPLKMLCDEIFGEKNFVSVLHWKKKKQPSYLHGQVAGMMEYILVYAKDRSKLGKLSLSTVSDSNTRIDNADNQISERFIKKGIRVKLPENVREIKAGIYKNKTMETEYLDDVHIENGMTTNSFRARARFRDSQKRIDMFCDEGLLFITRNYGFRRDKLEEETSKRKSITDLLLDWGDNQDSDDEQTNIFGKKVFSYPKPTKLIKNLIMSTGYDQSIILDFFAGSGTTGQAVLQLNAEDGGHRKFILCTDNENDICEKVTYERIKRVINSYKYEHDLSNELFIHKIKVSDFSVNKLSDGRNIPEEIEYIKNEQRNNYDEFSTEIHDETLYLYGIKHNLTESEKLPANLKYFRTDFVPKDSEDVTDELLNHISEMVELENGIKLDGKEYVLVLSDDEADELEKHWSEYPNIKALYISNDVLLTTSQRALFNNVEIHIIPDYYFKFEMQEAGEVW